MQQTISAVKDTPSKKIFKKISFINLDKKLLFALAVFLIMSLSYEGAALLLIVPFLALGYLLGFSYLLVGVIIGVFSTIVYMPSATYLYILLCLSFLLIILFTRILKMNMYHRIYLAVFLADGISRIFYSYLSQGNVSIIDFILPFVSLVMIYGLAGLSTLSEHKTNQVYPYFAAAAITVLFFLSFVALDYTYFNISLSFLLMSLGVLFVATLFDYTYAPTLIIFGAIIYYLFISRDLFSSSLLVVPSLFANIVGRKGKYQTLIIFLAASMTMIYLNKNVIPFEEAIAYAIITTIYILIPSTLVRYFKERIHNPSYQYHVYLRKMKEVEGALKEELSHISRLFEMVSLQYQCEEESKRNRRQTDQVYRALCINCPKNKLCYQNGDVKLVKLFFKSVETTLNKGEENFVEQECMKPSRFFALSQEFKNDYYREYKYHSEYQELKKALSKQVLGFKELIDNYKNSLNIENKLIFNYENRKIKDSLEQSQFDVIYVNIKRKLGDEMTIELGIKAFNEQEVTHKALRIIEEVMDMDLMITMIHLTSAESYYKVEICRRQDYEILHGIHQLHKENEASGDSYITFYNHKYNIYALSDGMGSGKEAQNKSRTTIKLLKGLIETGMDLTYGIGMINSLLKVKNRYDNYATLDILAINHRDLKARFTKNGAAHSYIFRQGRLICIDITSLPVGIVEDLDAYNFEYPLQKDDLIIMFSDGITCNEEQLTRYVTNIINYHPQVLAREIATKFTARNLKDDTTVMVIKIIEKAKVHS